MRAVSLWELHPVILRQLQPAIRTCLEQENAYTAAAFAGAEDFQKLLVAEMRGRIKEDDSTVPEPDGPFAGQRLRLPAAPAAGGRRP